MESSLLADGTPATLDVTVSRDTIFIANFPLNIAMISNNI